MKKAGPPITAPQPIYVITNSMSEEADRTRYQTRIVCVAPDVVKPDRLFFYNPDVIKTIGHRKYLLNEPGVYFYLDHAEAYRTFQIEMMQRKARAADILADLEADIRWADKWVACL